MVEMRDSSDTRSVGELVTQVANQSAKLARKEIELAQAELILKMDRATLGLGSFGGASALGAMSLGALTAAAILALALVLPAWLSALIIGALLGSIAGLMALVGGKSLKRATPPIPQQATESISEDVRTIKTSVRAGRA
jgi:tetrahydromethanopterin S-methyltransferase subunit C